MQTTTHPEQARRPAELLDVLLFCGAAAALRFFRLDGQSLWNDEMFSLDVATSALPAIQATLAAHYHHPPLFFILLHGILEMFGTGAGALRSLSALTGALTVPATYLFASRFWGRRAGVFAASLCLVAPFHLAYSQEARPYALAGLLCTLSCGSLMLALERRTPGRMAGYFASSLALLLTHHWGVFVLISQGILVVFFSPADRKGKLIFAALWAGLLVCYLPVLPGTASQAASMASGGWFWAERPNLPELIHLAEAFTGTYFSMASSTFDSPFILKVVAGIAGTAVLLTGMPKLTGHHPDRFARAAGLCLPVTLLVPFAASFIKPEIFLWYRYPVIVFPLFCLIAGYAAAADRRQIAAVAVSVLIAVGSVNSMRLFSWSKSNVRDVALYVGQTLDESGVTMLIRPATFAPLLNYYYHGRAVQYDETYLDKPLGQIVDTASAFMYVSLDVHNSIRTYMDGHFDKISERVFPAQAHLGLIVGVYRQKPEEE